MAFDGTIQELTVNMHGGLLQNPKIEVQQNDTASRKIKIHLKTFDNADYIIPYGATAILCVNKTDRTVVYDECEIIDVSTVGTTLSSQATASPGQSKAQIYICTNEGDIKSQAFIVNVQSAVYREDAIKSSNEFGILQNLIEEVGALKDGKGGSESIEEIEIVATNGKYAKWLTGEASGGAESSVSWAAHSQFIPVVPGETLRITCRSANNCPGVVFYTTDTMSVGCAVGYALENPGTGDHVSASINRYTYTEEDVVVPDGASYAILNNADAYKDWACQKVTIVPGGNDNTSIEDLEDKLANAEYENEQLVRRLANVEKYNDFTWGTFDKPYFVFIHDDSRAFIETAYNAFHTKGVPLSSAAIAPYLSNTYGGKTVKEWLDLIVADGGEVLCHYSYDLHDNDDDSVWYKYIVEAKREFEQNGFNIRGLTLAGSSDANSAKGEKICRKYFDYADKVGTSTQYNLGRKLMLIFDSLDAFKERIDICAKTPGIYAFGFHGDRDDETWITKDTLIDYITAKSNCEITTYSAVFDAIGTTVLEKRIAALEG